METVTDTTVGDEGRGREAVREHLRDATPPPPSITTTGVGLSAIGWFLFALLYSFLIAQDQPDVPFIFLFLGQVVYALLHGLMSVPVWWGTVRAMDDRHWVWPLAAHLVIAPVYASVGLEVYLVLMEALVGAFVVEQVQASYQWVLFSGGTVYAIQFAAYHLVRSVQRLRWREQQVAEYAALARERELAALKAQVHPHFLFNTLNSISSTVYADPGHAREMIADLAQLLRHSLDSIDRDTVALRDEIDVATSYLHLESHRFSDRLGVDVCVEVPDEALSARVPPMVVQPLVENAVKHGIGPKENGGRIRLQVEGRKDRLRVSIEDDGVGPGSARPLADGEDGGAKDGAVRKVNADGGGVGLVNTDARLRRVLGEESGLHTEARTPSGFRVWFDVPRTAGEGNRPESEKQKQGE